MKTFDQLIITTGFLASASPAMADEKPEADSGHPNILFILSDDHTSQAWATATGPSGPEVRRGESMEEY